MTLKTLGKYQIESVLGKGAMGVVYCAYDPILKRRVALKTISGDFQEDPELLRRFYREAQSAGGLRHNNIVTIYDLGEENHQPYIAMEYLVGHNLQYLINRKQITTLNQVLRLMRQCCEGLNFAHSHDIVHRDIKPANIFVLEDDTVKIVDFGIAMVGSSTITKTGMILGTVSYMSPEQVAGEELDGRSDQFSLGIILYEMVTGKKAFEGTNIVEIFNKITAKDCRSVRSYYPHCPDLLEAILDRCLAKDIESRYTNLDAMDRDIERLLGCLNKEFLFTEEVVLDSDQSATLRLNALDEVRILIDSEDLYGAAYRLDKAQQRWGGLDPILDTRIETLKARIRYLTEIDEVKKKLENILNLTHEGLYEQAEQLLENLEQEYPETPEIYKMRKTILEEKRVNEKYQYIKSQISKARFYLTADKFDQALGIMRDALNTYPEEKSLLGFCKKIFEDKAVYGKKTFREKTFIEVHQDLNNGLIDSAMARLEDALSRYPEEKGFQNFYCTLLKMKQQEH